jgi:hypothetical protein
MLLGELSDRLTDVAVVVHDLIDRESELEQTQSVLGSGQRDGRSPQGAGAVDIVFRVVVPQPLFERGRELRQEQRNSLLQL